MADDSSVSLVADPSESIGSPNMEAMPGYRNTSSQEVCQETKSHPPEMTIVEQDEPYADAGNIKVVENDTESISSWINKATLKVVSPPTELLASMAMDTFAIRRADSVDYRKWSDIKNLGLQSLEYDYEIDDQKSQTRSSNDQLSSGSIICEACQQKIQIVSKDKNLSRSVFLPCTLCIVPKQEKTLTSKPSTSLSHKNDLNKKIKDAFISSDMGKMARAIGEFSEECGFGVDADRVYGSTMQKVLFDAILCGKRNIVEVIIRHSRSRVFLAKADLTEEPVLQEETSVQYNTTTGNVMVKTKKSKKMIGLTEQENTPVDMFHGQTSLHLAVSQCDSHIVTLMLDRLDEETATDLINRQATGTFFKSTVPDGQFCLFLSAWLGCVDIFQLLINRGAALHIQDTMGNTILHKLVELSLKRTEEESIDNKKRWINTSVSMCEIVLESAPDWWFKFVGGKQRYQDATDSIVYLLSIKNNTGFTPLALAAAKGASQIFDVLVNSSAYRTTHFKYGPITDVSYRLNEIDSVITGNKGTSCLELIIYNSIDKACKFVNLQPIETLIRDKWDHYRKFYIMWALIYILYMILFSTYMFIRPTNAHSVHELYTRPMDKFRALLEVLMILGIPWYLYGEIQDLCYPGHRRRPDPWKYIQDGLYRIIRMAFVAALLAWVIVHFTAPAYEDITLSLCLFFGWIYVINFTCGSESFGIFPVMLQRMIFLDLLRFLVVFVIVIVSMSMAMYCVFQATPTVLDYSSIFYTSYSLFKMTLGLQDVGNLTEARHPGMAVFLFIVYAVLGNILLLNVLIAMMNESYASISEKAPVFQLETLQRMYNTLMIERRLPSRFTTAKNYYADGKSDRYTVRRVMRLGQQGVVPEDDYSINVQRVDYMSTT